MENGKETFWLLEELGAEKQLSFKIWLKINYLGIKKVYWISEIGLSKDREENVRDCFADQTVNFDY